MPKQPVDDDLDEDVEDEVEEDADDLDEPEDEEDEEESEDEDEPEDTPPPTRKATKKGAAKPTKGKGVKKVKGIKSDSLGDAIVLAKDGSPRRVDVLSISAVRAMVRSQKTGAEVRVQANEVFAYDKDIFAKLEERATKIHSLRDSNLILAGKAGLFGGSKRKIKTKVGVDAL